MRLRNKSLNRCRKRGGWFLVFCGLLDKQALRFGIFSDQAAKLLSEINVQKSELFILNPDFNSIFVLFNCRSRRLAHFIFLREPDEIKHFVSSQFRF